jgi:hypothetical protein
MTKNSANGKSIIVGLINQSKYWSFDRWGNAKNTGLLLGEYRFKFQDTSVRFERKTESGWFNVASDYYKNIVLTENGVKIGNRYWNTEKIFGI